MKSKWLAMVAFGISAQQKPGDPGDPARRDNLRAPKADGETRGDRDVFVRRTSLFLQAQTQPLSPLHGRRRSGARRRPGPKPAGPAGASSPG